MEPRVHGDSRGFFMESYRRDLFEKAGLRFSFVQDNHSRSAKGVMRGLHYQIAPRAQVKLVRVANGSVFDVVVDIREESPTYGRSFSQILTSDNGKMMLVSEGFAHGFLVLEDRTDVIYKVSDYYSPEHERGILWSDPSLGIDWPKIGMPFVLSEKDNAYAPLLRHRASS